MKNIFRIFNYLRYYVKDIVLNCFFNILFVIFSLFSFSMVIPFLSLLFGIIEAPLTKPVFSFNRQQLMDWVQWQLFSLKAEYGIYKALIFVSIAYVAFSFLGNLFRYLGMYFLTPVRNGIVQNLRNDLYKKITILPVSFFNKQRKGDLLSRFSSDLGEIEWSVASTLQSIVKDSINLIIFLGTLIFISPKLVLFTLIIVPLAGFFINKIGKSLKRNSQKGQKQAGVLLSFIEETLSGIRIIQAFDIQEKTKSDFGKHNNNYTRTNIKVNRRKEAASPVTETFFIAILVVVLLYGGNLVFSNELNAPLLVFFIAMFTRIMAPIQALVNAYYSLQKGNAAAERVFEILDANEDIFEKENAIIKTSFDSKIEYKDVSFAYKNNNENEKRVLNCINLSISKGEVVAIVGPSGAGKTTLVDLLPRFYDCTEGEITLDNTPIKDLNINSLRALSGIVSQDCILFNDTVSNNIAFGLKGISEEAIQKAAKIANADEFIQQLPLKYKTIIGDRGLSLSGGQRQRLSIARAILKNPPILILDEATSALDTQSEKLVQEALSVLMENRTSIIIAHRLSSIVHASKIIVMENGEIAESGSHTELLKQEGLYSKLYSLQSFQ